MVGPSGSVVATDLDTDQFAAAAADHANLIVRTEDVAERVAAHPDGRLFALAHARLVIGHVRDHDRAIANIVRAVRPGGWVLIEDADFLWLGLNEQPIYPERAMPVYLRVWKAVAEFLQVRGFDVNWGRRLAHAMADAGLSEVAGEAVAMIGSAQVTAAMRQTIERFGADVVRLQHLSSPLFSVWGRRSAQDA